MQLNSLKVTINYECLFLWLLAIIGVCIMAYILKYLSTKIFKNTFSYPDDVEMFEHHIKLKNEIIFIDKIISLQLSSLIQKTSMIFIPISTDSTSILVIKYETHENILKSNTLHMGMPANMVTIKLMDSYHEGLFFKNKKGQDMFEEFNNFHSILEIKTFEKRLRIYDQYESEKILFKYSDYVFLKDKLIMKNKKIVGNLYKISRGYKTIIFPSNNPSIFSPKLTLDISEDYDLFCYLLGSKAGINLNEITYDEES
jgi:hypothetical protein